MIMLSGDASLVVNQSAVTKSILDWKEHSENFVLAAWVAVGGALPLPFEFFYDWEETTASDTPVNHVNLTLHVRALGENNCPSQYNETRKRGPSLQPAPPTTGDLCVQILDSDMSTGFIGGAFMYAETHLLINNIIIHAIQLNGVDVNKIFSFNYIHI